MGRNGFGVGFSSADSAASPSPYARMQDDLGALIDDVSVAELRVAAAQADRARKIEQTRVWVVATALALPGEDSRTEREAMAHRSFVAQLSAALRMSEGATRNLIWASEALVNTLPLTLEYLCDGLISLRHAQIMVDQVTTLGPVLTGLLEQEVLCHAAQQTPPQFERTVRRAAEKLNLDDAVQRQRAAAEKRTTYIEPQQSR